MANNFFPTSTKDLEESLGELNRKMEEEEVQAKAASLGLPYVDLHKFPLDLNVLGMFVEEQAKQMQAVPFYCEGKDLRVGTIDPANALLKEKFAELAKKYKVSLYLVSKRSLQQALKLYAKVLQPKAASDETIRVDQETDYQKLFRSWQQAGVASQPSGSQLMAALFGGAMFYRASDIHLEPEEHFVKVRYRIDGVLQDVLHLDKSRQQVVLNRIKILSKLKFNVTDQAQDGRLTFYYLGQPVDVRVSVLPSAYGEETVMRLLGAGPTNLKLKDLGFSQQAFDIIQRQLRKPNGMIITTGPTGSGKTTSLYAFLNQLNEPGVKIITLEDPVEYKLEGVVQTPIDHNVDFSFAKALRAVLRQDPDIVMVGEIRDEETADVSTQASLTGHLVLSTLHTNDAAGAVPRLLNMGVKPFVLAPALLCVLAQRLVRRLCPHCKRPAKLSPTVLEKITYQLKKIPQAANIKLPKDLVFYHADGCERCHHMGYMGRIGIYEVLENTEAVQQLILKQTGSTSDFNRVAQEQGMVSMLQDGLLKALDGVTDVEEVFRVAGEG